MCACVTVVLDFAAHSIISGTDFDAGDCSEDDRYDSMGYGLDFKEFLLSALTRFHGIYFVDVLREM